MRSDQAGNRPADSRTTRGRSGRFRTRQDARLRPFNPWVVGSVFSESPKACELARSTGRSATQVLIGGRIEFLHPAGQILMTVVTLPQLPSLSQNIPKNPVGCCRSRSTLVGPRRRMDRFGSVTFERNRTLSDVPIRFPKPCAQVRALPGEPALHRFDGTKRDLADTGKSVSQSVGRELTASAPLCPSDCPSSGSSMVGRDRARSSEPMPRTGLGPPSSVVIGRCLAAGSGLRIQGSGVRILPGAPKR